MSLRLDNLKAIVCRSAAERQTLLHQLSGAARARWERETRFGIDGFFYRHWTYVESVSSHYNDVTFNFNPNTETPGPFAVRFSFSNHRTGATFDWVGTKADLSKSMTTTVVNAGEYPEAGVVTLHLDGCLAFEAPVHLDDLPF